MPEPTYTGETPEGLTRRRESLREETAKVMPRPEPGAPPISGEPPKGMVSGPEATREEVEKRLGKVPQSGEYKKDKPDVIPYKEATQEQLERAKKQLDSPMQRFSDLSKEIEKGAANYSETDIAEKMKMLDVLQRELEDERAKKPQGFVAEFDVVEKKLMSLRKMLNARRKEIAGTGAAEKPKSFLDKLKFWK